MEFLVAAAAAVAVSGNADASAPIDRTETSLAFARPLKAAPAVRRNALVRIRYEKGALSIDSEARALAAGNVGERLLFMNTGSHATFSAVVSGESEAVVK